MGKLNLSRRTFAKLSAATAATAVIGCAVPGAALAEDAEAQPQGRGAGLAAHHLG